MREIDLRGEMRDILVGRCIDRIQEMDISDIAAELFIDGYPDEVVLVPNAPDDIEHFIDAVAWNSKFVDSLVAKARNINEFKNLINKNFDKIYRKLTEAK